MKHLFRELPLALGLAAALTTALTAAPALAQVGSYALTPSAGSYAALPATATDVPVLRDDDATSGPTLLPLGFAFAFDGVSYTGVKACSNGFLSFNPNAGYNVGNALGGSLGAAEKPLLAPLWDDLSGTGPTARASYLTTGAAPNRVFTFEWLNWKWSYQAPAPSISFQVKLYEGSNRIEYVYRPEAAAPTNGPSLGASIGLAGGTAGTAPSEFVSLSDASAAPVASSATETTTIAAAPAAGQTYAFAPAAGGCLGVRNLAAGAVTATSAALSFQATAGTTGYVLAYRPTAGGATTTLNLPAATASPYTLAGLADNTAYTVTLTGQCGGSTSPAATVGFTTARALYCSSGLGGACGPFDLTAVVLGGSGLVARNLGCTAGGGPDAYTSYPAAAPTTGRVAQGSSYPLSVTSAGSSIVAAWADWNQNFVFEASEWVQVSTGNPANGTATVALAVPAGATLGTTALRVRSRQSANTNGAADACTNFASGETKDFALTVVGPATCALPTGLTATAVTGTGATLGYTAAGGGSHTLVYGPTGFDPATGGGTAVPNATNPLAVSNLASGTAYDFYVAQVCGPGNQSQFAGPVGFATAPANNDPCAATALPLTGPCAPQPFSSAGATVTTSPAASAGACMGANINPRDVWFSVSTRASGPGSTALRFSVTGNAAARVQLFRVNPTTGNGCAGPFISVACAGAATNRPAPDLNVSTGLTASTTYYLRVHGANFNDPLGPFTLCATAPGLVTSSRIEAAAALQVYPNPSGGGNVAVRLPVGHPAATLLLLNGLGQAVLQREMPAGVAETSLLTRGLAAGVYSLRVKAGGEVLTRKVVLE